MFTDIEGSTRLARMLGDSYGAVLGAHRAVLRAAVSQFGGCELFTEGDSFFIAFSDASAAIAACVAAQRGLAVHEWPHADATLRVRMGLHTGWATPANGEYASAEVHRAARVAAAAHGGQVLCSEATARAASTLAGRALTGQPTAARLAVTTTSLIATGLMGHTAARRAKTGWTRTGRTKTGWTGAESVTTERTPIGLATAELVPPSPIAARYPAGLGTGGLGMAGQATAATVVTEPLPDWAGLDGVDLLDLGPYRLRGFDDAERLFQIAGPGLERDFPHLRTPGAAVHNLPSAVTSFVGRRAELAELTALVERHRLVTVAGAGGTGKTRLALAAAGELLAAYPDGVWLVDAVTASAGLPSAVAAVLGMRGEPGRSVLDTLVERCAQRQMLLVLDTCEAAPRAAAVMVRRLLADCPRLDVLATGRSPVGLPGEVVWRIPALAPADAFALLSERLIAARGGRLETETAGEAAELARVASKLDGLPLAIELAAVRLRMLSAAQLAGRLEDPLAALDPSGADGQARQESLAATVEWSYRMLGADAVALLGRLAAFAGPVDLATVEWGADDALGALSELTEKSLLEVVPGQRYKMTAPIRGYVIRRLAAAGEEQGARDRHVAWSLHTLDNVAADADGQPRTLSLTELAPYVGEWQAALRWTATGGSVRAGLRLAGALDPWWREHGGARGGRDVLFRLYGRIDGQVEPAELGAAYLVHAGLADDRDERARFLERAESAARRAGHPGLLISALAGHRISLVETGRLAEAELVCREVIAGAERTGVPEAALPAVVTLAKLLWRRGALDAAADLLGGARQWEAGRPEDRGRRTMDWLLGMVALRRGDLVAAHDHLVVALRSRLRHGFRGAAADAVAAMAVRCELGGDPVTATILFGGAESVRGARRTTLFGGFWSARQADLRAALGDAAFDAAYLEGAEAGFDRIVAMALAVEHPDLERGSSRFANTLS
jgi:predicted ATPase